MLHQAFSYATLSIPRLSIALKKETKANKQQTLAQVRLIERKPKAHHEYFQNLPILLNRSVIFFL